MSFASVGATSTVSTATGCFEADDAVPPEHYRHATVVTQTEPCDAV